MSEHGDFHCIKEEEQHCLMLEYRSNHVHSISLGLRCKADGYSSNPHAYSSVAAHYALTPLKISVLVHELRPTSRSGEKSLR